MADERHIWRSISAALGAEFRSHNEIRGKSGLTHQLQAIAVDDPGKRVILISADPSPRMAALMRIDVQATMPDVRILVARPLALDLSHAVRALFDTKAGTLDVMKVIEFGTIIGKGDSAKEELNEIYGPSIAPVLSSLRNSDLSIRNHILNFVDQSNSLPWKSIIESHRGDLMGMAFDIIGQIRTIDSLALDRSEGICPIPTYEFSDNDWELMRDGRRIDDIVERLKALDIYQYFFPPIDDIALGLVDRGISNAGGIGSAIELAKSDGHQISNPAIVDRAENIHELLEALKGKGLIFEGELENELTIEGKKVREIVKFRPREGLIERLSKIFSIKIDINLKDLIK